MLYVCSSTKTHYVQFSLHTQLPCWSWNDLHCCSAPLSGNVGMFQCGYSITDFIYICMYMNDEMLLNKSALKLLMLFFFF